MLLFGMYVIWESVLTKTFDCKLYRIANVKATSRPHPTWYCSNSIPKSHSQTLQISRSNHPLVHRWLGNPPSPSPIIWSYPSQTGTKGWNHRGRMGEAGWTRSNGLLEKRKMKIKKVERLKLFFILIFLYNTGTVWWWKYSVYEKYQE